MRTLGALEPDASDLRVVDASGRPMGVEVVWVGPGDRVSFFFQVGEAAGPYRAYWGRTSPGAVPPPAWARDAGCVLEIRPWRPVPVRDSGEARAALAAAGDVEARVLRRKVFDGLNPGGPSRLYVGTYRGFFRVPSEGDYDLCTASSDASFLSVDGQPIAAWAGLHGPHGGLHGRFAGRARLTAGVHRLEYLHFVAGTPSQAAVVGWRKPSAQYYVLVTDADWVQPHLAVVGAAESTAPKPIADFTATVLEHYRPASAGEGDVLVRMRFEAASALDVPGRRLHWDFGDGRSATGARADHAFLGRGVRDVTLEVLGAVGREGGGAKTSQRVACDPRWEQPVDVVPGTEGRWRETLAASVAQGLRPEEVPAAFAAASALRDERLASAVGDAAFACADAMKPVPRVETFLALAELWSDVAGAVRDDAKAQRALFVALQDSDVPAPLAARAALAAADRAVSRSGDARAALAILESLRADRLSEDDRRRVSCLRADALATAGRLEEAAKEIATVGERASWSPKIADAARASRLHAARARLAAGDAKAAASDLEALLDDSPRERLRADGPVLLAQACLALDDVARAAVLLERALLVEPDGPRAPRALLLLSEARTRLGDAAAAGKARARLLAEFPYAEEAAGLAPPR